MSVTLDKALEKANQNLQGSGVKLEIRPSSNTLYLRGTFPPKPGSGKTKPYRQRIHLISETTGRGVKATLPAIRWATTEARRLSVELQTERFEWAEWGQEIAKQDPRGLTLLEVWDKWIDYQRDRVEATTLRKDYARFRRHLVDFGELWPADAIAVYDQAVQKLSDRTTKRMMILLNAACAWALERNLINDNPFVNMAQRVKVSQREKKVDPFSRQEVDQIIQSFAEHPCDRHYVPFVRFLFLTGCRTSEAVGLTWGAVYEDRIIFREAVVDGQRKATKTKKARTFPIGDRLKELLDEIRPEEQTKDTPVFLSPTGKLIDRHNFIRRNWKSALERAGVRYRYQYQTRHTFISFALSQGFDVAQISEWVGNSIEIIVRNYAGVHHQRKAPELV